MASGDFIAIDVQGMDELLAKLAQLPDDMKDTVTDDVMKYLKDVLQAYPPPKHVTRQAAYGQTFFSDKQRKWFFAALNSGALNLPYARTQSYRNAWQQIGTGYGSLLANETPYSVYLQDEERQSRMSAMIGWKKLSVIIEERMTRILAVADGAIKKAIRRRGLE
jgi:hypothetical protein